MLNKGERLSDLDGEQTPTPSKSVPTAAIAADHFLVSPLLGFGDLVRYLVCTLSSPGRACWRPTPELIPVALTAAVLLIATVILFGFALASSDLAFGLDRFDRFSPTLDHPALAIGMAIFLDEKLLAVRHKSSQPDSKRRPAVLPQRQTRGSNASHASTIRPSAIFSHVMPCYRLSRPPRTGR